MAGNGGKKMTDGLLIAALAAGASQVDAAKRAGLSESTVGRRMKDPTFRQELADAKRAMLETAVSRLTASATAAATTLYQLLAADSDAIRLSAARAILELSVRLREATELEARIAALEEATAASAPVPLRRRLG